MSTTIRMDDQLKSRVTTAAKRNGQTPHAFILDAIAQTVERAELDNDFHTVADQRWAKILANGKTVSWDDARTYLESRAQGQPARKPTARKPTR